MIHMNYISAEEAARWFYATRSRFSTRLYTGAPDQAQAGRLAALAHRLSEDTFRLVVLPQADKVFGTGLLGRSIKGASFGVGVVVSVGEQTWRAARAGEAMVLECTALGLGTCWVQGTYNHKEARTQLNLKSGEALAAVFPVGVPVTPLQPVPDDARNRKSLETLTGLNAQAFQSLPVWQQAALRCARIAPSAINLQLWRFSAAPSSLVLDPGHNAFDNGIVMLHLELGAAHSGVLSSWRQEGRQWVLSPSSHIEK